LLNFRLQKANKRLAPSSQCFASLFLSLSLSLFGDLCGRHKLIAHQFAFAAIRLPNTSIVVSLLVLLLLSFVSTSHSFNLLSLFDIQRFFIFLNLQVFFGRFSSPSPGVIIYNYFHRKSSKIVRFGLLDRLRAA
jgi:hypothetical protein